MISDNNSEECLDIKLVTKLVANNSGQKNRQVVGENLGLNKSNQLEVTPYSYHLDMSRESRDYDNAGKTLPAN